MWCVVFFFVESLNQYMKHVHNVNNFIKINVACGIGFKMNRTPSKKQLCLSMHRGKNQCNNKVVSCDNKDISEKDSACQCNKVF